MPAFSNQSRRRWGVPNEFHMSESIGNRIAHRRLRHKELRPLFRNHNSWQCGASVRMKIFLITAKLRSLSSKREEFLQDKSGTEHLDLPRWGGSPRDRRPRR